MTQDYDYSQEAKWRQLIRSEFNLYYVQNRDLFEPDDAEETGLTFDQMLELELGEACLKADIDCLQEELDDGGWRD